MWLFMLICSGKTVGSFVFSSSSLCLNPFYATDLVSSVSLSLSHWYPGSGVVLDCIDS